MTFGGARGDFRPLDRRSLYPIAAERPNAQATFTSEQSFHASTTTSAGTGTRPEIARRRFAVLAEKDNSTAELCDCLTTSAGSLLVVVFLPRRGPLRSLRDATLPIERVVRPSRAAPLVHQARVAMTSSRTTIPCLLLLLASACAEDEGPTTDLRSARTGWQSTEIALAGAGIQTGLSGSAMVDPDGVEGVVMGAVDCPDGGSLNVQAEAEVTDDLVDGELSIEFDNCSADGVTIDGSLSYGAHVTDAEVSAEMHGNLEWSGNVDGSCAMDLEVTVTKDGPNAGASTISGGLCGHAWTDVLRS